MAGRWRRLLCLGSLLRLNLAAGAGGLAGSGFTERAGKEPARTVKPLLGSTLASAKRVRGPAEVAAKAPATSAAWPGQAR